MKRKQKQTGQSHSVLLTVTAFCLAGAAFMFLWFFQFKAHVQTVPVNGARIAYYVRGQGQTLLINQGFGMTMTDMDPLFIESLSKHFMVVIYDYRGGGLSTGSVEQLTVQQMTDDAVMLLKHLGIQKASVFGWSYGTLIAQDMAVRYPHSVEKLVLASPLPGGTQGIPADRSVQLFVQKHLAEDWESAFVPLLFLKNEDGEKAKTAYLARLKRARQSDELPRTPGIPVNTKIAQEYAAAGEDMAHLFESVQTITAPTLILSSEDDMLVKPENAKKIARQIPSAQLRMVTNAGHGFLFQDPRKEAREIMHFLDAK